MADFHTYSSWGRTRRPKNVNGASSTAAVKDVASLAAAKTITDAAGTNKIDLELGVYSTENQRYLHISATTGGTVAIVWAYTHASGVWAELLVGGSSITVADGTHKIVEIVGIDLLAFNLGADTTSVYAACSTF